MDIYIFLYPFKLFDLVIVHYIIFFSVSFYYALTVNVLSLWWLSKFSVWRLILCARKCMPWYYMSIVTGYDLWTSIYFSTHLSFLIYIFNINLCFQTLTHTDWRQINSENLDKFHQSQGTVSVARANPRNKYSLNLIMDIFCHIHSYNKSFTVQVLKRKSSYVTDIKANKFLGSQYLI